MAKEYQSEKSPIFDSQKSKKTRRKLLKMSHIKAYKVDQMFCNTRYVVNFCFKPNVILTMNVVTRHYQLLYCKVYFPLCIMDATLTE